MNRPRLTLEQAQAVEANFTPIPNYSVDEMFNGTSDVSAGQHSILCFYVGTRLIDYDRVC